MKDKSLEVDHVYVQNFLYFLFAYFLLHLLLRVNISDSLELDESEQMLLSQSFLWGYNSQPPLYTWLQMSFFELFGRNIFAISLLKNSLLFLTYIFVYKSTKLITKNHVIALIATASLILIPQISWESQRDLTHSVLLTTISSMIFYIVMKVKYTYLPNDVKYYVLLGILIAAGMLSKYSFSIFIFSMALAALFDVKLRQFILSKKLIITLGIILCVVLPHALWLLDHLALAMNSTMQKLNIVEDPFGFLIGIGGLFKAIGLFLMPYLFIIFFIFYRSIGFKKDEFLGYFFIIVITVLILFVVYTGTTHIKDRWMQPYFFLMVIYIASMINIDKLKSSSVIRYFQIIYVVMSVILLVMFARIYFPDTIKKYYRLNYPFQPMAEQIKASGFSDGLILAGNKLIGGNMKLNFPHSSVEYTGYTSKAKKKFENILIVWDKKFPVVAKNYISQIAKKQVVSVKYLHSWKFHKHSSTFFTFYLPLISQTAFHPFHFSPSTF